MRLSAFACLIAAALGFGVFVQAASAAPIRVVDLGPLGDAPQAGGRWIAWAEADGSARAVSPVDVLTTARSRVAPHGCRYIDMDTEGDLLTCDPNDAMSWTRRPASSSIHGATSVAKWAARWGGQGTLIRPDALRKRCRRGDDSQSNHRQSAECRVASNLIGRLVAGRFAHVSSEPMRSHVTRAKNGR